MKNYDRTAAELAAVVEGIQDAQQRNATAQATHEYLTHTARTRYDQYTDAARGCLHWARIDREAGDRESAAWYLEGAARHRRSAAEWRARLRRLEARQIAGM